MKLQTLLLRTHSTALTGPSTHPLHIKGCASWVLQNYTERIFGMKCSNAILEYVFSLKRDNDLAYSTLLNIRAPTLLPHIHPVTPVQTKGAQREARGR